MNKIIKRVVSAVTAAIALTAVFVFDVPIGSVGGNVGANGRF